MYMLKNKIKEIQKKRNTIIQFSPPRSGSTLITNILKEIFPKKTIVKRHSYIEEISRYPTVITYRHPLDCIASSIQAYEMHPTDKNIQERILGLEKNGIWDIIKLKDRYNVLMLRYEDFVNDFNVIYSAIERFFSIKISFEKRQYITQKYQIDKVKDCIEDMSLFSFKEYDRHTLWHGNHISKYKGQPFYYKDVFTKNQIQYMKSIYLSWLLELNYD